MAKIDVSKLWSMHYRFVTSVMMAVSPQVQALGLETKELYVLSGIDEYPNPAALAEATLMPKPTITVYLKRLEALGFVRREIDPGDLRKHRMTITPAGRKVMVRGQALLLEEFGKRLGKLSTSEQSELNALLEKMS